MKFPFFKHKRAKRLHTIAFYNLENLFDTEDDLHTLDGDYTPSGRRKWTAERYQKKLYKLAKTISEIGVEGTEKAPVLVGVAEVENAKVLKDLLDAEPLKKDAFGFVHYDSPDERGIDTALIYHREYFEVLSSEPIALLVNNTNGVRDTTRDILYVHGKLNGEEVHVFVNHWPSRRDGEDSTSYKRVQAAETILSFMEKIEGDYVDPNYLIMGDFNDDPTSKSIKMLMQSERLYNPMEKLLSPHRGSANYKRTWTLFDQIIVSHNFFNYKKGTHSFAHANIFDDTNLIELSGRRKGNPFRTFAGRKYLGGYSDHFPVYIQLKFNK